MNKPPWVHKRLAGWLKELEARPRNEYDTVTMITGAEGNGKSMLAMHLLSLLDPTFDLSRITWAGEAFIDQAEKLQRGQARLLDEGDDGAFSRDAMSEPNKELMSHLFRSRIFGLHSVIIMPNLNWIDKIISEHRATYWILVEKRGFARLHKLNRRDYPGAKTSKPQLFTFDFPAFEAPWLPEYWKLKKARALRGNLAKSVKRELPRIQPRPQMVANIRRILEQEGERSRATELRPASGA